MGNLKKALLSRHFEKEFQFFTSRSSGPGGQHVNKTETKVELRFHVENSNILSGDEKELLKEKLKNKINNEGYLQIFAQEYRSQVKNRELTEKRFYQYLSKVLKKKKARVKTKPTIKSMENRIRAKKRIGEKKTKRIRIDPGRLDKDDF